MNYLKSNNKVLRQYRKDIVSSQVKIKTSKRQERLNKINPLHKKGFPLHNFAEIVLGNRRRFRNGSRQATYFIVPRKGNVLSFPVVTV